MREPVRPEGSSLLSGSHRTDEECFIVYLDVDPPSPLAAPLEPD